MPADFAEEPTEAQGLELVPQPQTPIVARHVRADAALVATVRGFVSVIREENAALAAYLEHGGPLEATSERIVLAYETDSFAVVQLGLEEHAPVLARAAVKVLGEACTFVLDTETPPEQIPMSIAALDAEARRIALEKAREAVREHPLVKKAIALFDAELRDVRLPQAADN